MIKCPKISRRRAAIIAVSAIALIGGITALVLFLTQEEKYTCTGIVAPASANCDSSIAGQSLWNCPMQELYASNGTIDLSLEAFTYKGIDGFEMHTRAFAGPDNIARIPGPIIHMEPSQTVSITLSNNLDQEPDTSGEINGYFGPDTTNLHLHGIHVGGERPADDVTIHIEPQQSFAYTYEIPSEHGAGIHYYHPHKHGSVALQVGGGAAGMLIIDETVDNSPQGFLQTLPEVLLVFQQFHTEQSSQWASRSGDDYFSATANEQFTLVNGLRHPVLTVNADQWYRLRILHSSADEELHAELPGCEMLLLAKDGIFLLEPRTVTELRLTQASRVDVAIKCPNSSSADDIPVYGFKNVWENANEVFMCVLVAETAVTGPSSIDVNAWSWTRPKYLQDMRGDDVEISNSDDPFEINFRDGEVMAINGQTYSGSTKDKALRILIQDTIEEWIVDTDGEHPLHVHVNPMQVVDDVDEWTKSGDFVDTLGVTDVAKVRTYIGPFSGKTFVHCHVSSHADEGMSGIFWVNELGDTNRQLSNSDSHTSVQKSLRAP